MTTTFKTHDIVKDTAGYSFRIYGKVNTAGNDQVYDVVALDAAFHGHTTRSASELTMVKEYINKVWNNDLQIWETH